LLLVLFFFSTSLLNISSLLIFVSKSGLHS
jgi:hypothetical protein